MTSGDVKRGAGNTVYLIAATGLAKADLDMACRAVREWEAQRAAPGPKSDSGLYHLAQSLRRHGDNLGAYNTEKMLASFQQRGDSIRRGVHEAIANHAVTKAPTGVNAHYRFASVRPGSYWLFAETTLYDRNYHWWAEATVKPGQAARVDLDNEAVDFGERFCGAGQRPIPGA